MLGVCGLFIAASATLVTPGTACACTCAGSETPEEAVSHASGVFVARATEKISGGYTDIYEFEVSEVFKGDVGATTTVGTPTESASCGTDYEIGKEYLLFLSQPREIDAAWASYSCGPYTGTPFDIRAVTEQVYGPPHPPEASAPESRITWWTRVTSVVPKPILALVGIVLLGFAALAIVSLIQHKFRGMRRG